MGTVKYTGPVASFHCPTNAEIRSLKVHFSPKQEGTGDPSPENVREIVGWDGIDLYKAGRNLLDTSKKYQASSTQVTIGQNVGRNNFKIFLKAGTYTITTSTSISASVYIARKSLKGTSTKIGNTNQSNTFTIDSDDLCELFVYKMGTGITVNDIISFQLEYNFTATSYEPYQGSTTDYEFGVLGKNKLDPNLCLLDTYWSAAQARPGTSDWISVDYISVSPNTTYTITGSTVTSANPTAQHLFYNGNKVLISTIPAGTTNQTFTTPNECKYIRLSIKSSSLDGLQLELGSTATAYEPYDPNHTVYGGWVDLITGELASTYIHCKIKDLPGEWNYRSGNIRFQITLTDNYANAASSDNKWTNFATSEVYTTSTSNGYSNKQIATYIDKHIYIRDDDFDGDVDAFLNGVGDTYITYELAESTTYSLSPTQLQTFLGQNNVWSNADYVEVEYDLHETQSILARKQFIMANQPHVVTPAAAPLQNFVTDVPAPLKECKIYFEPKQDLHGYSNPWSAGGGKNIAKPYDNSYVSSTYISFDYSAANGTFRCYGTASASSTHSSPSATNAANNGATFTLPAGTYTLSIIDGDGTYIYAQCVSSTETVLAETTSHTSFTTNEALTVFVRLKVTAGATVDNTVKIQLEEGSTATSYVPYENICPIEGWTDVSIIKNKKSIVPFQVETMTNTTNKGYNGNAGWSSSWKIPDRSKQYCYSVYIDNTNASDTSTARIWLRNIDDSSYSDGIHISGNNIAAGSTGWSTVVFNPSTKLKTYYIVPGLYLSPNASASNPMVELGSTATDYEPYSGTTIPITFPATKNLFDETYENISGNVTYKSLYVGNNAVTASSDMPLATNSYSNLFILPGQVTSGASTGTNNFNLGQTRTVTPIDGYVTIGYRNNYDIDPRNYHAQIERGSVATAYEPYGTIYGGYVDLVNGEVVAEWGSFGLGLLPWTTRNNGSIYYFSATLPDDITSNMWTPNVASSLNNYPPHFISDRFTVVSGSSIHSGTSGDNTIGMDWSRTVRLKCDMYEYDASVFKAAMDGVTVLYELATPIHYSLTPTQLKALRGTNNIWSNSNGDITIQFWSH